MASKKKKKEEEIPLSESSDDEAEDESTNYVRLAEQVPDFNVKDFDANVAAINNIIGKRIRVENNCKFDVPQGDTLWRGSLKAMALAGGRYSVKYNVSYVGTRFCRLFL